MARKDHTQVAERIRGSALGLFHEAHDALVRANDILTAGAAADAEERKSIDQRIGRANAQLIANNRVADKLKELLA